MKLTNKIPFIIVAVTLVVGVTSWYYNKDDFFKANIMQLLSLAATSIISVIFVQHLNEKRSKREMIVKIVMDILEKIEYDEDTFSKTSSLALVKQRTVGNKIKYLIDYSEIIEIECELKEIRDRYDYLKEIFCEKFESEDEYKRALEDSKSKINDRCNKIIMLLYSGK